jgi:hypothetical protein
VYWSSYLPDMSVPTANLQFDKVLRQNTYLQVAYEISKGLRLGDYCLQSEISSERNWGHGVTKGVTSLNLQHFAYANSLGLLVDLRCSKHGLERRLGSAG